MGRRISEETRQRMRELIESGMDAVSIGKEVGVHRATVMRMIEKEFPDKAKDRTSCDIPQWMLEEWGEIHREAKRIKERRDRRLSDGK